MARARHVGLTGGIASGKSAAARRLAELGAVIVDADVLAREVVEPGTPGLAAVVERFGRGVLTPEGRLDRPALGRRVFADAAARADLEAIIHPAVRERADALVAQAPVGAVVVDVIPLLVEAGLGDRFDEVIVVDVDPAVQRERLAARDGADAVARIAAQASRADRLAAADVVWDNNGDAAGLTAQIDRWWHSLSAEPSPPRPGGAGGSSSHGGQPWSVHVAGRRRPK